MLVHPPFPQVAAWIDSLDDGDRAESLREYLYAVGYHLALADDAERRASGALTHHDEWGLSPDGATLYLLRFEPLDLVRYGDISIRQAASALDVALQFVNAVLDLGVGKDQVRWGRDEAAKRPGDQSPLRLALTTLDTPEAAAVVAHCDTIYGSIGLELLHGYRHWVTHRGAPRIRTTRNLHEPIALPAEVAAEQDERQKKWEIERLLMTDLPRAIRVECYPFVPSVGAVYNFHVDEATEDIDIPGFIHIGAGSKNITVEDASIGFGSPLDSATEFLTNNPVVREEAKVRVAGEDLAVYKAWDYSHALSFANRFVQMALSGDWDAAVAAHAAGKQGGK
jgi:hypothetical protein